MAIVRMDKVAGTHLESIKADVVLKNGYFVELGGLVVGETELREVTAPTNIETGDIVFHSTAEVDPDPRKAGLKHFEIEAGKAGRGYRLVKGDIMTLTADLFASIPVVGDILAPQVGAFTLEAFDSLAVNPAIQVKVIQETTLGYDSAQAFAVQVIKA
jgi:hypothetical protein